jgi:Rad3-related DNA helicase
MSGEYCCLIVYGSAACFSDYNDMADNKAYLESVARSLDFLEGTKKLELILFPNHQRLQRQVKLLKALMVSLHLLIKWHR